MTDESGRVPDTSQPSDSSSPSATAEAVGGPVHSRGRSVGTQACPSCGSSISAHASVCPVCGEGLKDRSGRIRCRHCGERSTAELTVCPYCGRELASAHPRSLTWGIPILLVVLFLVLIVRQADGRSPLAWAQDRLTVEGFSSRETAARGLVVVMTPVQNNDQSGSDASETPEAQVTTALAAIVSDAGGSAEISVEEAEAVPAAQAEVARVDEQAAADGTMPDDAALEPATGQSETEVATSELTTTEQINDVGTIQPATEESQPQAETASDENTDEDTAEPEVTEARVEDDGPSDGVLVTVSSVSSAAEQPALPTATATSTETATPELTSTPTATATPIPTETSTPVPMPTYEIQRGDTLVVIARKQDVSVEDLMRVNGLAAAQAFTIQPGQELLIPVDGSTGVQEPTAKPAATLEPTIVVPATNTPAPTPTTPALRLDAPILRSPEPGTPVSCSNPSSLAWLPVPFMRADDRFVLHLGFVGGRTEDGRDMVIWVLEQPRPANATSWDMDGSLCAVAQQEYGRVWQWYVEVSEEVDGVLKPVSPASEIWQFTWN